MNPIFFNSASDFRNWLEANHQTETEILVGYYKIGTNKPSLTWSESVDEALCFGWIDGIRKSIDTESYCIRFTPRNPKSNWSSVNIKKVEEMIRLQKMNPAGLAAFKKRLDVRTSVYSYENKPDELNPELKAHFIENKNAWDFFMKQSLSYRKTMFFWIMSAKQESTQKSRLNRLIASSSEGKRIL